MASIDATGKWSVHATLTADTVDDVTFSRASTIEVVNKDGADAIYFTVDGSDPTVDGDDTYYLPAAAGGLEGVQVAARPAVVKLISSGTPAYYIAVQES